MQNCIFCKIVKGEIPATKIYENDKIVAFLDIAPVNPGHALVVSKKHFENLLSTPNEILAEMILKSKIIAKAIVDGLGIKGFNLAINNGKVAGQVVFHVHFHIIPRYEGDGRALWLGKKTNLKELEKIAKKIRKAIAFHS